MRYEISSLDIWWRSLDLDDLQQIYVRDPGLTELEFMKSCDTRWNEMSYADKREVYNQFKHL